MRFPPIAAAPPERFAQLRPVDARHKQFNQAVHQLAEEGLLQIFLPRHGPRHPILGVVGPLQFDVIESRLATEYGLQCHLEPLPYIAARWPVPRHAGAARLTLPVADVFDVQDRQHRRVLLFASDWALRYCAEGNPDVQFHDSL